MTQIDYPPDAPSSSGGRLPGGLSGPTLPGMGAGGGGMGTFNPAPARAPGSYTPAVDDARKALDTYAAGFAARYRTRNPSADATGKGLPDYTQNFQAALQADPQYRALHQAHQQAIQQQIGGYSPLQYDAMKAALDYYRNAGSAVATDAGSRRLQAQGANALDTGRGSLATAQGTLAAAQAGETQALTPAKVRALDTQSWSQQQLTPAQRQQLAAQAAAEQATANQTQALTAPKVAALNTDTAARAALTPVEVRKGNADAGATEQETRLRPEIIRAAQAAAAQQAAQEARLRDSEIVKNSRNPITGEVDQGPAAAPAAAAPPAAPARSLTRKAFDAISAGVSAPFGSWKNFGMTAANPLGAAAVQLPAVAQGWNGAPPEEPVSAPMAAAPAAPVRKVLGDGRVVEIQGGQAFQIMPDGTRRPLRVTQ